MPLPKKISCSTRRRSGPRPHHHTPSSRRRSLGLSLSQSWTSSFPRLKRFSADAAVNIQGDVSITSFSVNESEPLLGRLVGPTSMDREEGDGEEEETSVSFLKVLRLSSREWWLLLLGVLGSVVDGAVYPVFAIIFGEALEVFSLPASQVVPNIHKWAELFLVLGVVSGISVFIKVGRISGWGQNGRGSDPLRMVLERELQHLGRSTDSKAQGHDLQIHLEAGDGLV